MESLRAPLLPKAKDGEEQMDRAKPLHERSRGQHDK